jgi:3-dehydroquinate synthetase
MSKWWYVKLNEQHCEIRMGTHIVVGMVLEESFAKEICEARHKAQRLEKALEEIDNHIRCTDNPIPYIVKTLKELKGDVE